MWWRQLGQKVSVVFLDPAGHPYAWCREFPLPEVAISLLCTRQSAADTNSLCDLNSNLRCTNVRLIKILDSSLRILGRLEANVTYPTVRNQACICDFVLLREVRTEFSIGEGRRKPADEYSGGPAECEQLNG